MTLYAVKLDKNFYLTTKNIPGILNYLLNSKYNFYVKRRMETNT